MADFGEDSTIGNLGSGRFSIIPSEELENLFDFQFPEFGVDESKLSFFQLEALKVLEPTLGKYFKYQNIEGVEGFNTLELKNKENCNQDGALSIRITSYGYLNIRYVTKLYAKEIHYNSLWENWIGSKIENLNSVANLIVRTIKEDRNPF